jgi:CTP synthase (UTP-ammonia lyase)
MTADIRIGVVGDYNPDNPSHLATNDALRHSADALSLVLEPVWVATTSLRETAGLHELERFRGILAPPGNYQNMEGALAAIRFIRERDYPLLATCWGFQHVLVEYARNVVGILDAGIQTPDAPSCTPVVAPVACPVANRGVGEPALVGRLPISLRRTSRAFGMYQQEEIDEPFFCNYELNPRFRGAIEAGGLQVSAVDAVGNVRMVELPERRFFFATLFQPQRASRAGVPHPLITAFVRAAMQDQTTDQQNVVGSKHRMA